MSSKSSSGYLKNFGRTILSESVAESDEEKCYISMKDSWEVLKTHISNASSRDLIVRTKPNSLLSHRMNARI